MCSSQHDSVPVFQITQLPSAQNELPPQLALVVHATFSQKPVNEQAVRKDVPRLLDTLWQSASLSQAWPSNESTPLKQGNESHGVSHTWSPSSAQSRLRFWQYPAAAPGALRHRPGGASTPWQSASTLHAARRSSASSGNGRASQLSRDSASSGSWPEALTLLA